MVCCRAGTQSLTQQYGRLQQQLALMAQQNGGFPFLPPPSLGAANPFSGLNAQQVPGSLTAHLRISFQTFTESKKSC